MCLLDCCFPKKSKLTITECGGYVFNHKRPCVIELTIAKIFLSKVKTGDDVVVELGKNGQIKQCICEIIAKDEVNGLLYIIPKKEILVSYDYISIKRLLSN